MVNKQSFTCNQINLRRKEGQIGKRREDDNHVGFGPNYSTPLLFFLSSLPRSFILFVSPLRQTNSLSWILHHFVHPIVCVFHHVKN